MEPSFKAYYYGAEILQIGGANFTKVTNELNL